MPVVNPPVPALRLLLLAATLAAVSVAFIQSGVHAAGGAIQVLEMRQQVNFPDGVGLTLTAESDADIVEVRVYFRAAGSRRWGYAYADFKPGSLITATRSIPVSEATYLAPGVDVEYYFQIRDAHGAVLKTERSTVEYLDNRFDWKRVNIGPLELVYHDIRDDRVAGAARELSRDLQRVVDLLQFEPRKTFKGVIYNSYADANAVFPGSKPDHHRPRHIRWLRLPGAGRIRGPRAGPPHHRPRIHPSPVPGSFGRESPRRARLAG